MQLAQAVEEGIVPGGGVVLIRAAKALDKFNPFPANNEDETAATRTSKSASTS
jgi:chaperonin GroEL (HSP60 family)